MKKVYFVQVGFEFDGAVYLPYAAGTMIAYCRQNPAVNEIYDFSDIIFFREKLSDALAKITDPYMVAFSASVWNMEYNKALARLVKAKYPGCLIVFGGHSVNEDASLLSQEEYTDILIFGEGEKTLEQLLLNLADGRAEDTPNIALRINGETVKTRREYYYDLSGLPSPYTAGVFDDIMSRYPGFEWLAVLETNRGCPYSCAYCDWTAGHKMRFFPMEKVLSEISWLSEHKIGYCFCADSNFGMFDRDVEIAEALIRAKKATGYPEVFRPCYEKNSADRVFRICSALNSVGMDKGATMAYQTLSDEALFNIGRKNLTMEHFAGLMRRYNEAGIPTYSELILGLPGETLESFCRGMCRLLENGQHNSLSVYHCEALPNSRLTDPEYVRKHKIEIIRVEFNHIHSAPKRDEEVQEYSYLVRSTETLSRDDWVRANLFSVCLQCFHSLGLLRCFSMYLHAEKGVPYYDFYSSLLKYIMENGGKLGALFEQFRQKYESSLSGDWNYYNERFGPVTWFFEEGAFLEIAVDPEPYYEELMPFLGRFGIEPGLFDEIMRYQRLILRTPDSRRRKEPFGHDLYTFYDEIVKGRQIKLEERPVTVEAVPRRTYDNVADYAKETVWFGRRRGATILSGDEIRLADDN